MTLFSWDRGHLWFHKYINYESYDCRESAALFNKLWRYFCDFDEVQQTTFFNEIARIVAEDWEYSFNIQAQAIVDCDKLDTGGLDIMHSLGKTPSADQPK